MNGSADNYLPHFERLPAEVQRSLIAHYERLALKRSLSPRDRAAATKRAETLKERFARSNEDA